MYICIISLLKTTKKPLKQLMKPWTPDTEPQRLTSSDWRADSQEMGLGWGRQESGTSTEGGDSRNHNKFTIHTQIVLVLQITFPKTIPQNPNEILEFRRRIPKIQGLIYNGIPIQSFQWKTIPKQIPLFNSFSNPNNPMEIL